MPSPMWTSDRKASLAELVERVTDRFQASDTSQPTDIASDLADSQVELREILPVLELLNELGRSVSNCDVVETDPRESREVQMSNCWDDFRIIRELGRGGMGIVYEAEQLPLGRHVALKVLSGVPRHDGRRADRFENEIRVAAALDHPHIVPVYGVGKSGGTPFYIMRLIRGSSLDRVMAELMDGDWGNSENGRTGVLSELDINRDGVQVGNGVAGPVATSQGIASITRRLGPNSVERYAEIARLGLQAANALQHAHDLGIIHRDVKPSNLLLADDGHLWLADFGLARFSGHADLTATGDVIGTLRYMAPEQAHGASYGLDQRADVYALGVTLYELLTLQSAFVGERSKMLLCNRDVRVPILPRQIIPTIPPEMETIVTKAMAYEREDRYASARDLANDLQSYLEGRPIQAKPPTVAERLVKLARRHAVASFVAFFATLLVTLTMSLGVFLIAQERNAARASANRERRAASIAKQQTRAAEQARHQATVNFEYARAAVDRMFARADNELPRAASNDRMRHDLLEDARDFYRMFVQQEPQNDSLKYDLAVTFDRVGEIHYELGHEVQAEVASQRAFELFSELASKYPGVPKYLIDLAENATDRAQIRLVRTECRDQAAEINRLRIDYLLRLVRQFPRNSDYSGQVAVAYTDLAELLAEMDHPEEARDSLNLAMCFWNAVGNSAVNTTEFRIALARTHVCLANTLYQLHCADAARDEYEVARDVLEGDQHPRAQRLFVQIEQAEARLLVDEGKPRQAISKLSDGIARCAHVAQSFPDPVEDNYQMASCQWDLYRVMKMTGHHEAASQSLTKSTQQLEVIARSDGGRLTHRLALARNYFVQGAQLNSVGATAPAVSKFDHAAAILESCAKEFPSSSDSLDHLAWFLMNCPIEQFRDDGRGVELACRAKLLKSNPYRIPQAMMGISLETVSQPVSVWEMERAGQLSGVSYQLP